MLNVRIPVIPLHGVNGALANQGIAMKITDFKKEVGLDIKSRQFQVNKICHSLNQPQPI